MAYTKTQWKDKVIERPRTFTIQNNPDGTVTLIPVEGTVYEPGTPVNAANLNKLETQYDEAKADIDAHAARMDNPHNVTKAQVGLGNVSNVASSTSATANTNAQRDGNADLTSRRFISTVATGTAPFGVTSTTKVSNLNVDRVDDLHFRVNNGVLEYSTDGSVWNVVAGVKNVQRGYTQMSADITNISISSVNLNKSFVTLSHITDASSVSNAFPAGYLTSSTNLRLERVGSTALMRVAWEVVEFN